MIYGMTKKLYPQITVLTQNFDLACKPSSTAAFWICIQHRVGTILQSFIIAVGISSASIPLLLQLCTAQYKIAYPVLNVVRSVWYGILVLTYIIHMYAIGYN